MIVVLTAGKSVTLSLDGDREVSTDGETVGDVLAAEGVEVGERDVVAPGLDAQVTEGTRIAVRFARPVDLTVDGDTARHWVTATDVTSALDQIGVRYADARLSTSRGATISRSGMTLRVVTPKKLKLVVGAESRPRRGGRHDRAPGAGPAQGQRRQVRHRRPSRGATVATATRSASPR